MKIDIIREDFEATVKVKIPGEPVFTFTGMSAKITEETLQICLPLMLRTERQKRERKRIRREELAIEKAAKLEREKLNTEVIADGAKTQPQEEK